MNAILKSSELELHPLCVLFPRLTGAEFDALAEDIRINGLRNPIILHDGMILDGGNRYRACLAAGVEPDFIDFDGGNPVSFVLSANLHRRHMSAGQQAAIVATAQDWAMAHMRGGDRRSDQSQPVDFDSVAKRSAASGASRVTQMKADKVAREAPELAVKVAHGEISLPAAHKQVSKPPSKILPRPEPEPAAQEPPSEIESIRAELAEARAVAAELAADLEAYAKASEGEEAAAKEIKRLLGMIRVVESQRDQFMTQNAEMKKTIAAKDRVIAKLEGKK